MASLPYPPIDNRSYIKIFKFLKFSKDKYEHMPTSFSFLYFYSKTVW